MIAKKVIAILGIIATVAGLIGFGLQLWELYDDSQQRRVFDQLYDRDFSSTDLDVVVSATPGSPVTRSQFYSSTNKLKDLASRIPELLDTPEGISTQKATAIVSEWNRHSTNINQYWKPLSDCLRLEDCIIGERNGLRACQLVHSQYLDFKRIEQSVSGIDQLGIGAIDNPSFANVEYLNSQCFSDTVHGDALLKERQSIERNRVEAGKISWKEIKKMPTVQGIKEWKRQYGDILKLIVPPSDLKKTTQLATMELNARFDERFCDVIEEIFVKLGSREQLIQEAENFPLDTKCSRVDRITYNCKWSDLVPRWSWFRSGQRWQGNEKVATSIVAKAIQKCLALREFEEISYEQKDDLISLLGGRCSQAVGKFMRGGREYLTTVQSCRILTKLSLRVPQRGPSLSKPYEWEACFNREDSEDCISDKLRYECESFKTNSEEEINCRGSLYDDLQKTIVACVKDSLKNIGFEEVIGPWSFHFGIGGEGELSGAQFKIRGGDFDTVFQVDFISNSFVSPFTTLSITLFLSDYRSPDGKRAAFLDGQPFEAGNRPLGPRFSTKSVLDEILSSDQLRFEYFEGGEKTDTKDIDITTLRPNYNALRRALGECGYRTTL